MANKVIRAEAVDKDLDLIFDHLFETAALFGEDSDAAFRLAEKRLLEIEHSLDALETAPHQGTLRPHLGAGIRNVTKHRAAIYFKVDDDQEILRVLAVFFGGQDHDARILLRLLS